MSGRAGPAAGAGLLLALLGAVAQAAPPVPADAAPAVAAAAVAVAGTAPAGGRHAASAERLRLLAAGEALLAAGDAAAAEAVLDRAALLEHAGDTEVALVRSYLQAGDYRRALTFAAHAAGAHRDEPAATALYAWLLQRGGQGAVAARLLDQALAGRPDDGDLRRVQALIDGRAPTAAEVGSATGGGGARPAAAGPPLRLAPYAVPAAAVPAGAAVAGSGVLVGAGSRAVVPARTLGGARRLWVRNGLGQTVAARLDRVDGDSGLALLGLSAPLSTCAGLLSPVTAPFAGSPAAMVGFDADESSAAPAWPQLRTGFFARRPAAATALRPLGIEAPPGPLGGPVFDAAGRLAGIAMTAADGAQRLLGVDTLTSALGEPAAPAAAPGGPAAPVAVDGVYECALRVALQVIVQPAGEAAERHAGPAARPVARR